MLAKEPRSAILLKHQIHSGSRLADVLERLVDPLLRESALSHAPIEIGLERPAAGDDGKFLGRHRLELAQEPAILE